MQVLLNKKEKEQLVIDLHRQNKTIREIAQRVHMSFKDIGSIIRTIDGGDDNVNANYLSNKSKETKAFYLFKSGKKPLDVAIELDLPASQVYEIQLEYWSLKELHDLVFVYNEIKYYLPSFIKLFHTLKRNKMLGGERITRFLRYADHDLPSLENKIRHLSSDAIDLKWKKRQSEELVTILNSSILQLKKTLNSYDMAIGLKKQILADLDRKINQKLNESYVKSAENGSIKKQTSQIYSAT
jgi:ribosomal protein L22